MKRLIAAILIALIALALAPITALAAPVAPSEIYVGGTNVVSGTDATYWASDGAGGVAPAPAEDYTVRYDGAGTLYLRGAHITASHALSLLGSDTSHCGIYANGDLAIALENDNDIILPESTGENSYCVYVNGKLTIAGPLTQAPALR